MPRPTFLVAEPEPAQALSIRKLMLETAKFNVITAHSTQEAIDLFHRFPNIDAVILANGEGIDCDKVAKTIKTATHKVKLIHLSPNVATQCSSADCNLSSHEPEKLMDLVRSVFGDPRLVDGA